MTANNISQNLQRLKQLNPEIYDAILQIFSSDEQNKLNDDYSLYTRFCTKFYEQMRSLELQKMTADPFYWENFYALPPQTEYQRFQDAVELSQDKDGRKFDFAQRDEPEYLINLCACRRLADSESEIDAEALKKAQKAETQRFDVEYLNALYSISVHDYEDTKDEKNLQQIEEIYQLVARGKYKDRKDLEEQFFKKFNIAPTDKQKKQALNLVINTNTSPLRKFLEKGKKYRPFMHSCGQMLDKLQKFEAKNPLFGLAVNFSLAGNPLYIGYRSILASRALYNDWQGYKDYAIYKELNKNFDNQNIYRKYKENNADTKVTEADFIEISQYKNFSEYEKNTGAKRLTKEEFTEIKSFVKKNVLNRKSFENVRLYSEQNYSTYKASMGEQALSEETFNNIVKYIDIRRSPNYDEYRKRVSGRDVGVKEFTQIKALMTSASKVSKQISSIDKKTINDFMTHSVIFVRSFSYIGQCYALSMAFKNMVTKSYWKGIKAKVSGTGNAIKKLWKNKGKDKKAWKELYDNGGGLVAEAAGFMMLNIGLANISGLSATSNGETLKVNSGASEDISNGENSANDVVAGNQQSVHTYTEITDAQKQNLADLFRQYPRAATIILEGNETPEVQDVTNGSFKLEGAEYHSGVLPTRVLGELYEQGKLTQAQVDALVKFADEFHNQGNVSEVQNVRNETVVEDANAPKVSNTVSSDAVDERPIVTELVSTSEVESEDEAIFASQKSTSEESMTFSEPIKLDTGGYKIEGNGFRNGIPFSVTQEFNENGVMVQECSLFNYGGGFSRTLTTTLEADGKVSTVVGIQSGDHYSTRNSTDYGIEQKNALSYPKEFVMISDDANAAEEKNVVQGKYEHQPRESMIEEKGQEYQNGNKNSADDHVHRHGIKIPAGTEMPEETDDYYCPEDKVVENRIWTREVKGRYWLSENSDGSPHLHFRPAPRQQLEYNSQLVSLLQDTIVDHGLQTTSNGEVIHYYSALNGYLQADNFGGENKNDPSQSGISVKCYEVARQLEVEKNIYNDMQRRLERGEELPSNAHVWMDDFCTRMNKCGLENVGGEWRLNQDCNEGQSQGAEQLASNEHVNAARRNSYDGR